MRRASITAALSRGGPGLMHAVRWVVQGVPGIRTRSLTALHGAATLGDIVAAGAAAGERVTAMPDLDAHDAALLACVLLELQQRTREIARVDLRAQRAALQDVTAWLAWPPTEHSLDELAEQHFDTAPIDTRLPWYLCSEGVYRDPATLPRGVRPLPGALEAYATLSLAQDARWLRDHTLDPLTRALQLTEDHPRHAGAVMNALAWRDDEIPALPAPLLDALRDAGRPVLAHVAGRLLLAPPGARGVAPIRGAP